MWPVKALPIHVSKQGVWIGGANSMVCDVLYSVDCTVQAKLKFFGSVRSTRSRVNIKIKNLLKRCTLLQSKNNSEKSDIRR